MRDYFYDLADQLQAAMQPGETFLAWYDGEESSFVRFNQGKVRQPGSIAQRTVHLDLVANGRQTGGDVTLAGDPALDRERFVQLVTSLRAQLPHLPEDPYLLYNTRPANAESVEPDRLPPAEEVVGQILTAAKGHDFVGLFAHGSIAKGFASSLGQRNWFTKSSFNLDWSLYAAGDKAVKSRYAGFTWDRRELDAKMRDAAEQLALLKKPAKTIEPGHYRVYLAPAAVLEVLQVLGWNALSMKALRTKTSPLLKLAAGEQQLSPQFTLVENTREGAGPSFQAQGFVKPPRVELIKEGRAAGWLTSPRSAKEYGVESNGAAASEEPLAYDMAPGSLPRAEALAKLGTGVWVNNLWYLNYSDKGACRITGMTRFASFWVENGKIVAPLNVMRFDETLYRMFGSELEALTKERDVLLDGISYVRRSTGSAVVPGALVRDFAFTL
jgi:predicted Zn-dependent protease